MENLVHAMNIAFTRVQVMEGSADKLVYFFGRMVLEDFMEITLVCYHGYGVAASKLVRSMYEYSVTLRYLHEHPREAETFLAYHLVQQDKLISRLIETFGDSILPAELIAETRRKAGLVAHIWDLFPRVPHICPTLADVGLCDSPRGNPQQFRGSSTPPVSGPL